MFTSTDQDFFDSSPYSLNKTLLSSIGQWPYQNRRESKIVLIAVILMLVSLMIPQFLKLVTTYHDVDIAIECITPLMANVACFVKLFNCVLNAKKMRTMLDRVKSDWDRSKGTREGEIVKKYAENSRRLTKIYLIYMYVTFWVFASIPLVPQLLDVILPLNESRPIKYLFPTEYFIDPVKYFYPIWLHTFSSCMVTMTLLVAVDTMYVTYVNHACSIFAVVKYRLENAAAETLLDLDVCPSKQQDKGFWAVRDCIIAHRNAIEFATLLRSTYSVSFFLQLGINMLIMSLTGVQTVAKIGEPENMMRYAAFATAQLLHLFFNSLPGQKLVDQSLGIAVSVNRCEWYKISLRARRLLLLILLRSSKASTISAGKLYVMGLENFCTVVQTSMSYFTVLSSMR